MPLLPSVWSNTKKTTGDKNNLQSQLVQLSKWLPHNCWPTYCLAIIFLYVSLGSYCMCWGVDEMVYGQTEQTKARMCFTLLPRHSPWTMQTPKILGRKKIIAADLDYPSMHFSCFISYPVPILSENGAASRSRCHLDAIVHSREMSGEYRGRP